MQRAWAVFICGLSEVGFYGKHPESRELCEEKIDYPEKLSKQEKETGWS